MRQHSIFLFYYNIVFIWLKSLAAQGATESSSRKPLAEEMVLGCETPLCCPEPQNSSSNLQGQWREVLINPSGLLVRKFNNIFGLKMSVVI